MMDAEMECFKQQFFANQSPHMPSWSSTMPSWSSTMPSWSSTKRHEGSLCLCASSCKQCSDSTSLRQHIVCLLGSCTTMAHLLASCSNLVKWNVLHMQQLFTYQQWLLPLNWSPIKSHERCSCFSATN